MTQVRTKDLVSYFECRISQREEDIVATRKRFDKVKLKYETKFFPKLFGWKFENSFFGYDEEYWTGWDRYHMKYCKEWLVKLEYISKLNVLDNKQYTEMPENHSDAFFHYAKENNLPY